MSGSARRTATIFFASIALSSGTVALAHEDHDSLGAGPARAGDHRATGAITAAGKNSDGREIAGNDRTMDGMEEIVIDRNRSFGERMVRWLGRLHATVIHFPIALFVGAAGVELFGVWRGQRAYRGAARVMLVVGAIGAIIAALLGWIAGGFYWTDRNPVLMAHRWLGTAIAALGVGLACLAARHRGATQRPRTVYWALLGIVTVAVSIQAFLGGTFMHGGWNHLAF